MERKPLVRKLSLAKRVVDGLEVYAGTLGSNDVVAIVTGMGTRLAATGLERLLAATDVDRVVVVGVTGALEDDTPIGALVLPETVVDGATGGEHRPAPLGPGEPEGAMWTSDTLTTDPATLTELRARGVVALDMETAALAEVCEGRGIPWSVFRAISDRASDGSVDEEVFHLSNQDGTPNPAAVARYFLRHPLRIPTMARMAKGARLATETAADAAISACSEL
jgi:nucleoside phosphorylase